VTDDVRYVPKTDIAGRQHPTIKGDRRGSLLRHTQIGVRTLIPRSSNVVNEPAYLEDQLRITLMLRQFTAGAILLLSAGCGAAEVACEPNEQALQALAMSQANTLSAVVSALRELRRNDSELAISTLEGQLKTNMTALSVLSRDLKGNQDIVKEALSEAQQYAAEHQLK
jgi:hypothetical protein